MAFFSLFAARFSIKFLAGFFLLSFLVSLLLLMLGSSSHLFWRYRTGISSERTSGAVRQRLTRGVYKPACNDVVSHALNVGDRIGCVVL